jgi:capsular exopolysaccharide synthesis family protein
MLERSPASNSRLNSTWDDEFEQRENASATSALLDVTSFLKRNAALICSCALLSLSGALAYVITATPLYTATAQLLIANQRPSQLLRDQAVIDLTLDNAQVESQVEIIRSERLANAVVRKLDLHADPEFQGGGSNAVRALLQTLLSPSSPEVESASASASRIATAVFRSKLDVRRVGQSYVIAVAVTSTEPQKAAQLTNAVVEAYLQDQIERKAEAARQEGRWLEERLAELRSKLNTAARTVQDFRRNGMTLSQPGSTNSPDARSAVSLAELESLEQAYRRMYEILLQRITENTQQQSYPVADARVNNTATEPLSKSHPKSTLVLALALLVGTTFGAALAAVRDQFDRVIRTPNQVRRWLGLRTLATVPFAGRPRHWLWTELGFPSRGKPRGQPLVVAADRVNLFTSANAGHLQGGGDALRAIRTAIEFTKDKGRPNQLIGITSLRKGEGKSTLANHLASMCGVGGFKTLLVDSDFKTASLTKALDRVSTVGLVDILIGDARFEQVIPEALKDGAPLFHFLPAGLNHQGRALSDLTRLETMQDLLAAMRQNYDLVLFDLPSFSDNIDARSLCAQLDATLLTVEWGQSSAPEIKKIMETLEQDEANLLGVVLNKAPSALETISGSSSL